MDLLATGGDKRRKLKNKRDNKILFIFVKILAYMSQEDHVNYAQQRLPLPTPPPRKKLKPQQPQPPMDVNPQLYSYSTLPIIF
jgi:hypothetical protein